MLHQLHTHWKDILLIIGGVGTLWGIGFSLYQFLHQNKAAKPNIKATISAGANVYGNDLSEAMLYIQGLNLGTKAINIVGISVQLPDGQKLSLMDGRIGSGLPYALQPEGSARYWIPMKDIAKSLKKNGYSGTKSVKGVIRDAVGREYVTKGYQVKTIEGWSKS